MLVIKALYKNTYIKIHIKMLFYNDKIVYIRQKPVNLFGDLNVE
jgi:hypothetical protein